MVLLISCNSKPKFSESEKTQARLFIEVIELDNKSINISNAHAAYESLNASDIENMLNLKVQALEKAEQIQITVLSKMNKDLPKNYRYYKKGLSVRIENLKIGNINAEVEGSKLLDEWATWYDNNKKGYKNSEIIAL